MHEQDDDQKDDRKDGQRPPQETNVGIICMTFLADFLKKAEETGTSELLVEEESLVKKRLHDSIITGFLADGVVLFGKG